MRTKKKKMTIVLKKIAGRLSFIPPEGETARAALRRILDTCEKKHGGYVSVTFKVPYKKRTSGANSQNSCIHGYANAIAEYTGEELDRVKFYAKRRAMRRGYPAKRDDNGNVILSLIDGEPLPASSAEINTLEAGFLIDELQQIAAEIGVVLPRTMEEIGG
jgi:hypothetical protein